MAEMNDLYQPGDFDLAGFSVGIVEKDQIIDGSHIQPDHHIYGLSSSGIHSNGFSLVRRVLTKAVQEKHQITPQDLLIPTKLYVNEVLSLISEYNITGIAHITGGGLEENADRILPEGLGIHIDRNNIPIPNIFNIIQDEGHIDPDEMNRVFNMGIGMVLITPDTLPETETRKHIGTIIRK